MTLRQITLRDGADLDGFRTAVRALVAHEVPPEAVSWGWQDEPGLFGTTSLPEGAGRLAAASRGRGEPHTESA